MPRKTGMEGASYGPEEVTRVVPVDSNGKLYSDVAVVKAVSDQEIDLSRSRRTLELILGSEVVDGADSEDEDSE